MDRAAALRRLGGDEELFRDLVRFFNEDAPILLQQVREGIRGGRPDDVTRGAHSLKGLCAGFSALAATEAAAKLEAIGRSCDLTHADGACDQLGEELARLTEALRSYS
jgi:HPt (histidine-containing phosphotransfer) domain-containing protein